MRRLEAEGLGFSEPADPATLLRLLSLDLIGLTPTHILNRGNYLDPHDEVHPATPKALPPLANRRSQIASIWQDGSSAATTRSRPASL